MKTNFQNFKSYNYYQQKYQQMRARAIKTNFKALAGSAIGVIAGLSLGPMLTKSAKIKNNTLKEVVEMLSMAGLANVSSVAFSSIDTTKEQKKKKWREAGFQIMNTTIPMLMVSGAIEICNNVKKLNNKPAKIIGSIAGMIGGAFLATQITNLGKKENEPKRKYSIKDSVANFDDVVATVVIGFPQYQKLNSFAKKILPFIYTYCGLRSGNKE